jgi:hypothetical protein
MSENRVVPFGKYKGQPIEAMAEDTQYMEWLTAQSWFRERYQQFYTLIINNFTEPSDTPEHNRLHVKFLNDDFCIEVASQISNLVEPKVKSKDFEDDGYDVSFHIQSLCCSGDYGCDKGSHKCIARYGETCDEGSRLIRVGGYNSDFMPHVEDCEQCRAYSEHVRYECGDPNPYSKECQCACHQKSKHEYCIPHQQCEYSCHAGKDLMQKDIYRIEIKPTVSDDFPSILRAMKRLKPTEPESGFVRYKSYKVLCLHQYTGEGATQEEFVAFMESQGIKIVWI